MSEKISPERLTRIAYVYVRQSSLHQVRHHREGLARQYALAERAQSLGFRQVVVIDDDFSQVFSPSPRHSYTWLVGEKTPPYWLTTL